MSMLPDRLDDDADWRTSRQVAKATRLQESIELAIHNHNLAAQMRAAFDRADTEAAGDACDFSLKEELKLLKEGLAEAGQSATGIELVSGKLQLLNGINNHRIARRFGG